MRRFFALLPFILIALPDISFAQVVMNEVMYNPQGSDTGREWVEFYNEGKNDVTMVGGSGKGSWRINDGSNHTLTDPAGGVGRGSLTIPAGGYIIVASDPTDFISGEYAGLPAQAGGTYSVVKSSITLNNNGATLTLLDGTGATLDSVTYAPSQGGNDDGSSLQRQSDGSWIAALPTPGAANSIVPYVAPVQNTTSSQQQTSQQSATSTDQTTGQSDSTSGEPNSTSGEPQTPPTVDSYVAPPTPSLYADAGGDRMVIVGADVEFDASAYDKTQTLLDPSTVRFMWNFGDGSSAEGESVLHHFSYPGRYAVVLEIANNKNAAIAQINVTADPAALSFSFLQDGGAQIVDLAGRDLDLSGWVLRQDASTFAAQFILPQHSEILSDSSMQISPQTLSFRASSSTMLEYPNGALALAIGQSSAATSSQIVQEKTIVSASPEPLTTALIPKSNLKDTADPDATVSSVDTGDDDFDATGTDSNSVDPTVYATSSALQTAAVASSPLSKYLWWIGVAALALAMAAALVAASHFKKGEWDIVEDSSE